MTFPSVRRYLPPVIGTAEVSASKPALTALLISEPQSRNYEASVNIHGAMCDLPENRGACNRPRTQKIADFGWKLLLPEATDVWAPVG